MKTYRAAVIGCGRIGSEFDKEKPAGRAFSHAGGYFLCKDTRLVAAADPDPAKRKAFTAKWGVESVYSDYRKMLQKVPIDILSVATPPETHWPIVREACRHPLQAIYCEKPIAADIRDAKKMTERCRAKNILLIVNHQRRFGAFYQELKAKLAGGVLGRVQQVTCYYTRGIANTCTHLIDLFVFLFGPIQSVEGEFSRNPSPFKDDPNVDGILRFKSGLALSLKACDDSRYLILEADILTTQARIRMGETLEYSRVCLGKNLLKLNELSRVSKAPFKAVYPQYGMVPIDRGVAHAVDCLKRKRVPLSNGESATHALAALKAMRASARNKKMKHTRSSEVRL